jgi:hypothetical protein
MQRPTPVTDKVIFLDIDQTLLCTTSLPISWYVDNIREKPENYHIQTRCYVVSIPHGGKTEYMWGTFRPYYKEFLMFCFWYFKYVIIWSAGSKEYVYAMCDRLFKDLPAPDMILSREHCDSLDGDSLKSLPRLIQHLKRDDITLKNSVFIDDLTHNFRHNPDNGITIPEYRPERPDVCVRDSCLSDLCVWFSQPHVAHCDDIRNLSDKNTIFSTTKC